MNKEKLKYFLQRIYLIKKDSSFYHNRTIKLRDNILKETNWLAGQHFVEGKSHSLPFQEQAIKYYEYKNMIIQRRSQYVIIFLTIVLLIITGFQIYLTFFRNPA